MTSHHQQDTRSVVPAQATGSDPVTGPERRADIRHRVVKDEEAYRRSLLEQAKTDIAAGW